MSFCFFYRAREIDFIGTFTYYIFRKNNTSLQSFRDFNYLLNCSSLKSLTKKAWNFQSNCSWKRNISSQKCSLVKPTNATQGISFFTPNWSPYLVCILKHVQRWPNSYVFNAFLKWISLSCPFLQLTDIFLIDFHQVNCSVFRNLFVWLLPIESINSLLAVTLRPLVISPYSIALGSHI